MNKTVLNISGRAICLDHPIVMGIVNVTPDSFAIACRDMSETQILDCANRALAEGATILDIGAYSTRPGAEKVSMDEEWTRLEKALRIIRQFHPDAILSVDTFRAEIAQRAATEYGVQIINDISGGELDSDMFATVSRIGAAYVLMHMRGTPQTMQQQTQYPHLMADIVDYMARKIDTLHQMGVSDIIVDPGFCFAKTQEQNYHLLQHLSELQVLGLPILAGLSRKSMIYKQLNVLPDTDSALVGTIAANMEALRQGAAVLRVHDVRQAVETIQIYNALC